MKNKSKYIILSTILFQSIIILMFNISILVSSSLISLKKSIPFFNVIILFTTILILISLRKLSYYEKKEAELELMKTNMKNTEELIKLLHSQRHDYLTHIQSISALLYLKEYDELTNYLNGISKEYRFTSEIVRLGHPALTALINAKRVITSEKGILFHVKCKNKVDNIEINSWELCSLFSNLLENAIEAVAQREDKKWIKLFADYDDEKYIFEIENSGNINEDIMKNLFDPGITSKTSAGRGYGLYLSKEIVDKHSGSIEVINSNYDTVKAIIHIPREAGKYDKKVS